MSLTPIINPNTDILFRPLNLADSSSDEGHYFAFNKLFWSTLQRSKLINVSLTLIDSVYKGKKKTLVKINGKYADDIIFKRNDFNYNNLVFSIRDLAPDIISSKSSAVKITYQHNSELLNILNQIKPKIALLLHSKVRNKFLSFLENKTFSYNYEASNSYSKVREVNVGPYGKLINELDIFFYCIDFPSNYNNNLETDSYFQQWKSFRSFLDKVLIKSTPK